MFDLTRDICVKGEISYIFNKKCVDKSYLHTSLNNARRVNESYKSTNEM